MANNYLTLITVQSGLVQSLQFQAITSGDVTAALGFTPSNLGTPVSVANGGTGASSLTAHAVLLGGSSAVGSAAVGTAGRLLIDQGAGADPAFEALSGDATLSAAGALTLNLVGINTALGDQFNFATLTADNKGRVVAGGTQQLPCKAYCYFLTGSPATLKDSFNVSSVTHNATNDYTVNLTTAMKDANFAVAFSTQCQTTGYFYPVELIASRTTTAIRVTTVLLAGSGAEPTGISVAAFGPM